MIRLGVRGWELHRGAACDGCTPVPGLRDRSWACLWLQQLKTDPAALYALRHVLQASNTWWPLHKATSDQTIAWMANLLRDGEWHVHAPVLPDTTGGAPGESAAPEEDLADIVSAPPAPGSSPPPRPSPPPQEGQLPRTADEQAIAAAMKQASALGIPFCEECARAALKRAGEAAVA